MKSKVTPVLSDPSTIEYDPRLRTWLGDIDLVDDVLVLEPAGAGHRRVRPSCAAAAAHARRDVKRIA